LLARARIRKSVPALFHPGSDSRLRLALALLFGALVACPCALLVYVRTPYVTDQGWPVDQPVLFDHRHHVEDDGIDCLYCHSSAERSSAAGIPSTSLCMGCHNQIWSRGITLEPLRRAWASKAPLPWRRVHDLPDHVYFDHSIHVRKGIGCVSCHGRVDRMARVHQVEPLTMGWCLDCHRDPTPHVRPRDTVTDMTRPDPSPDLAESAALAERYGVHSDTHCTTCHR
jgi:hypothetical protein